MTGSEIVLSILSTVVVALIGVIINLVMKGQTKFEARMEKHVHDLRGDIQTCAAQVLVLKTVIVMQLPTEMQGKINALLSGAHDSAG